MHRYFRLKRMARVTRVAVCLGVGLLSQGSTCANSEDESVYAFRIFSRRAVVIANFDPQLIRHSADCTNEIPPWWQDGLRTCTYYEVAATEEPISFTLFVPADSQGATWRCAESASDLQFSALGEPYVSINGASLVIRSTDIACTIVAPAETPASPEYSMLLRTTGDGGRFISPDTNTLREFETAQIDVVVRDQAGNVQEPDNFEFRWQWRSPQTEQNQAGRFTQLTTTGPTLRLPLFSDIEVSVTLFEQYDQTTVQIEDKRLRLIVEPPSRATDPILLLNAAPIPAPSYTAGSLIEAGIEVYDAAANESVALTTASWRARPSLVTAHGELEGYRIAFLPDYSTEAPDMVRRVTMLGGLDDPAGWLRFQIPDDAPPGNYWLYLDVIATPDGPAATAEALQIDAHDSVGRLIWFIQVIE